MNGDVVSRPSSSAHDTVKVEVETLTQPSYDGENDEYETTKVNVELPVGYPELKLPDDPQAMLATARSMVHEATQIHGPSSGKGKRKAEEIEEDDDQLEILPPKRVKAVQTELRKEKIKRRALTGIVAGLAFGYVLFPPSILLRLSLTKISAP